MVAFITNAAHLSIAVWGHTSHSAIVAANLRYYPNTS